MTEQEAARARFPQRGKSPASVPAPPRHPEPLPVRLGNTIRGGACG